MIILEFALRVCLYYHSRYCQMARGLKGVFAQWVQDGQHIFDQKEKKSQFFLPSLQSLLTYQKFIFPVIKLLPFLECVGCFMHSNSLQRTPASNADDKGGLTEMHLFGTNKGYTAFYPGYVLVAFILFSLFLFKTYFMNG